MMDGKRAIRIGEKCFVFQCRYLNLLNNTCAYKKRDLYCWKEENEEKVR